MVYDLSLLLLLPHHPPAIILSPPPAVSLMAANLTLEHARYMVVVIIIVIASRLGLSNQTSKPLDTFHNWAKPSQAKSSHSHSQCPVLF